jgi:hypothetical protein
MRCISSILLAVTALCRIIMVGFINVESHMDWKLSYLLQPSTLITRKGLGGLRPVVTQVAAKCRVGKDFVCKIERELMDSNRVLTSDQIYIARDIAIGLGSKTMTKEEMFVLYQLYWQ